MKKLVLSGLLFFGYLCIVSAQKPEKIYSSVKVYKPHSYFVQQAEQWWKEIEKNKSDENAWYNYYKANRYSMITFENSEANQNSDWVKESTYLKEPEDIYRLIEKNIPNTYTCYRYKIAGNPSDTEMYKSLLKAYEIDPVNTEIFDSFVTYYEMKGIPEKREEFNEKQYYANNISAGFLAYGYNVLMSMKPGGIILTSGDNDTYPLWLLQDVLKIRTDITVFNILLLMDPDYGKALFKKINLPDPSKIYDPLTIGHRQKDIVEYIFKNKSNSHPLYVGMPAWKYISEYVSDLIAPFEKNLYLIGLVLEFSNENIDNIASLKNNFENTYTLDYIRNGFEYDISAELVNKMNINYLPAIFKLYEHYTLSGDLTNAKKMKELGLFIAQKGGQDWLDKASLLLK
jgi:hypothetical protein